jgi:predicted transcriptional regulator
MIKTVLVEGYWWHPAPIKCTRDISKEMSTKVLKCVKDNPGIQVPAVAEVCDTTVHYARVVLRRLIADKKVTKKRDDRDVHYWVIQA